jgi:hypothetical protein
MVSIQTFPNRVFTAPGLSLSSTTGGTKTSTNVMKFN